MFALTEKDRCILSERGYSEKSIVQIEEATRMMFFGTNKASGNVLINMTKAIHMLGRENFLLGVSRATFHWTADIQNEDGHHVFFDASKYFVKQAETL